MSPTTTIEQEVPQLNIKIIQSQSLAIPITWKIDDVAVDLANSSFKMQIRTPDLTRIIDELTTANGRITIGNNGLFTIIFPSAATSYYKAYDLVYSLRFTQNGESQRLFEGKITVDRDITR